jgi:hypothetical protein
MEAQDSPETLVSTYTSTGRYDTEHQQWHLHRRENLRSYIIVHNRPNIIHSTIDTAPQKKLDLLFLWYSVKEFKPIGNAYGLFFLPKAKDIL